MQRIKTYSKFQIDEIDYFGMD